MNIVWSNTASDSSFAKDIVDNLFDQPFDNVCKQFVESAKELLFTNISPFIIKEINNNLIYNENNNNVLALTSKTESTIKIIKSLNNYLELNKNTTDKIQIIKFIEYGSKYVLQKMILQEYNYYPDFIATKRKNDITLIMVEIKKYFLAKNQPIYNLKFKYKDRPLELDGLVKDYFLIGNIMTDITNDGEISNKIKSFRKNLWQKGNIGSNITLNNKLQNKSLEQLSSVEINKLIS